MRNAQQADFKPFDASGWRVGVVVARFNRNITDQLLQSALTRAKEYSIPATQIDSFMVAGVIEIPLVLQQLAANRSYQALLAIGCVIKGDTPHFDYVCQFVTEGVLRVQLDHDTPIGFGVLTCINKAQAQARAQIGGEHLDAVLHQAKLLRSSMPSPPLPQAS